MVAFIEDGGFPAVALCQLIELGRLLARRKPSVRQIDAIPAIVRALRNRRVALRSDALNVAVSAEAIGSREPFGLQDVPRILSRRRLPPD